MRYYSYLVFDLGEIFACGGQALLGSVEVLHVFGGVVVGLAVRHLRDVLGRQRFLDAFRGAAQLVDPDLPRARVRRFQLENEAVRSCDREAVSVFVGRHDRVDERQNAAPIRAVTFRIPEDGD